MKWAFFYPQALADIVLLWKEFFFYISENNEYNIYNALFPF